MEFEFDRRKSEANEKKHGIDFELAQLIWKDPDFVQIPARTTDEPRYLAIGRIGNRYWSAIFTVRDYRIRTISVHRSRREEVLIYKGEEA